MGKSNSFSLSSLENFSGGILIFVGIIATLEHLFRVQLVVDPIAYLGAASIIILVGSYLEKAVVRMLE